MFLGLAFFIGTGVSSWYLVRVCLRSERLGAVSVVLVPLICDGFVFVQALPFLAVPRGAAIRPMAWAFYTGLLALGLTIYGFMYALAQWRTRGRRVLVVAGLVLSLLPIPILSYSLQLIAAVKGFQLAP